MLIRGPAGSGKTTLALQIANAVAMQGIEPKPLYCTCEGTESDFEGKRAGFGLGDVKYWPENQANCSAADAFSRQSSVLQAVVRLSSKLKADTTDRLLVIVDGLNLLSAEEEEIADLESLVSTLRSRARIGIIVYEPGQASPNMNFISDTVIELRERETTGPERYYLTELCFAKSRYQQTILGWHQYKIRKGIGLQVFPSVHYRVSEQGPIANRQSESTKPIIDATVPEPDASRLERDSSLISELLPELRHGSCTALLGPRGTMKTLLSLDFLRAGSRESKTGLVISVSDIDPSLSSQRKSLCEKMGCRRDPRKCKDVRECYGRIFLLPFRPGCITTSEVFSLIEDWLVRMENDRHERPDRLVLWDLAQLEHCYPLLAQDPMFLTGLKDYVRHSHSANSGPPISRNITSLFMGPSSGESARTAFAIADNVLFCWNDELKKNPSKKGVAIFADKLDGRPGESELWFIPNDMPLVHARNGALSQDEPRLKYAGDQINAIHQLQGLAPRTIG